MNKEIGSRIKRARLVKQIDRKTLADEIGILDTSLSKIEREGTNNLKTLIKIASALGVKPGDLIDGAPAEPVKTGDCLRREELIQFNRELMGLIRNEIAKIAGAKSRRRSSTGKNKNGKQLKKK